MKYMVERLGDISGKTFHNTLQEALNQLEKEYPIVDGERQTPDPEDDRILIWERLDNTPDKVVWHFSGWHWDFNCEDGVKGGLEQGKLGNDRDCLYNIACDY